MSGLESAAQIAQQSLIRLAFFGYFLGQCQKVTELRSEELIKSKW
jgi:hypothetical protein